VRKDNNVVWKVSTSGSIAITGRGSGTTGNTGSTRWLNRSTSAVAATVAVTVTGKEGGSSIVAVVRLILSRSITTTIFDV
jgi:hypothetical protein